MADEAPELPGVDGFRAQADGHGAWVLSRRIHDLFAGVLDGGRYSRPTHGPCTRRYTNLVVLFRVLLFYGHLRHTPSFWAQARDGWGVVERLTVSRVALLVDFFTDARLRSIRTRDHRPETLLMRLTEAWAELRARTRRDGPPAPAPDDDVWAARQAFWLGLRDTSIDMLLDPSQPPCLLGPDATRPWSFAQPQPPRALHAARTPRREDGQGRAPRLSQKPPTGRVQLTRVCRSRSSVRPCCRATGLDPSTKHAGPVHSGRYRLRVRSPALPESGFESSQPRI